MKIIELTPTEIIVAAHRAGLIRGVKKFQCGNGDLSNRRISKLDDFGIHYLGMLGEVAVGREIGVPVREDVTKFGDGMVDMEYRGQSIQIKTSSHANLKQERLAFLNYVEEFTTDWLIVCSIQTASSVAIHGFISRAKFKSKMFTHDFGYGPRVCVKESELSNIGRLQEAVPEIQTEVAA